MGLDGVTARSAGGEERGGEGSFWGCSPSRARPRLSSNIGMTSTSQAPGPQPGLSKQNTGGLPGDPTPFPS